MKGILINYKSLKRSKSAAVMLCKKLYGYKDFSNKGKYRYTRKGLLDEISYVKLAKSVFILKEQDVESFISLLKKYKIDYEVREVKLTKDDKKVLF